jgi:hypothetical protein
MKSRKNILCTVLIVLFIFDCIFFYSFFPLKKVLNLNQENLPKSSTGEINITSPENTTYSQPDYGFFPGTFGFESGTQASEINNLGGSVDIIQSIAGHNTVMALSDTNSNYRIDVRQIFKQSTQSYGTIEFWLRTADHGSSKQQYISFVRGTGQWNESDYLFAIVMNLYGWNNCGDRVINEVPNLEDNVWFHCRIDFECTSGNYTGLNQYHWRFTVNGIPSDPLPFLNNFAGIDFILFQTGTDPYGMTLYIDSIGYSWDPNYSLEDNLNEGLLLSYENTTNLDWQGYSLDGASHITILGNKVIPFPTDGHQHIQVFGNYSLGNSYKSNLRLFSIDSTLPHINILGPLQNSYYGNIAPLFQVNISGENLSSTFYRIGDSKIHFYNNQGQINQNLWNKCAEGLVLISFYANNTLGKYSVAEIKVYKDTILPFITTQFSYEDHSYDTPPYFFLTISDANLDLKWFTLNNDPTKYYLAGQNIGFGSELWYNLDDGVITITVYATDKAGNENSYEFHVIKDLYSDYPYDPDPYNPSYYPSFIAIVIGGFVLLAIIVTIIVVFANKNAQTRPKNRYYIQPSYQPPPVETKRYEYSVPKRMLKCPYCSNEEDIDGNFCPRCGARLK